MSGERGREGKRERDGEEREKIPYIQMLYIFKKATLKGKSCISVLILSFINKIPKELRNWLHKVHLSY